MVDVVVDAVVDVVALVEVVVEGAWFVVNSLGGEVVVVVSS